MLALCWPILALCQPVLRVLRPVGGLSRVYWSFLYTGVGFCARTRDFRSPCNHLSFIFGYLGLRPLLFHSSEQQNDKQTEESLDRAFGGINVLFAGDFWQLDPPGGSSIASIPVNFIRRAKMYDPKPNSAHGEALFWGDADSGGAIQGVTELTENIRTEDAWLHEVQEQMRTGTLSEDNWNFLHGRPTSVPG
eukprot:3031095-Karenia_brevis.AAC.1